MFSALLENIPWSNVWAPDVPLVSYQAQDLFGYAHLILRGSNKHICIQYLNNAQWNICKYKNLCRMAMFPR